MRKVFYHTLFVLFWSASVCCFFVWGDFWIDREPTIFPMVIRFVSVASFSEPALITALGTFAEHSGVHSASAPRPTHLTIPKLSVDISIGEGDEATVLRTQVLLADVSRSEDDVWVLAGHRFGAVPAGMVFFHLPKLQQGDRFTVDFGEQTRTIIVDAQKIIAASDVDFFQTLPAHTVVLMTCTPLWTARDRLLVIGHLQP